MKILIDECVPRPIKRFLKEHECRTVTESGYSGYENGDLLKIAERDFDCFLTADQNLSYQQNLASRKLAILLQSTNDWDIISAHGDRITQAIASLGENSFLRLDF